MSSVRVVQDHWLTSRFEQPVFQLSLEEPAGVGTDQAVGEALVKRSVPYGAASYWCKVGSPDVLAIKALTCQGFYVVDVNVTYCARTDRLSAVGDHGHWRVGSVRPEHRTSVLDLAGRSFRYSRFHLDPGIPKELADSIKQEWVGSYLDGTRGDQLFISASNDDVIGFLAALRGQHEGEPAAVIDLIAVAPSHQGRGLGRALVHHFAEHYAKDCKWVLVGTQVANIPSIRFYESQGFKLVGSRYVLHLHTQRPWAGRAPTDKDHEVRATRR